MTANAYANKHNNLHIFVNECLRLNDNASLLNSLATSKSLKTVYFYRNTSRNRENHPPIHRTKFLLESLQCLQSQLTEFCIPFYLIDAPLMTALGTLVVRWKITRVTMESPNSYAGKKNIIALANFLASLGAKLVTERSNNLYDIAKIQPNIRGRQFLQITDKMTPLSPVPQDLIASLAKFGSPIDQGVNMRIPSIGEFGVTDAKLEKIESKYKGGELEAMQQLVKRVGRKEGISDFSALSPALNFGCISPRLIHDFLCKNVVSSAIRDSICSGLKKRDYLILIGGQCPNIDNQASIYNYILPWDENAEHISRFEKGETGFPIIDAIIAQIKKEGHIDWKAKEILAKFLTCGLLWLGWHHGVKLFYDWSLDFNSSICGLSWMYAANSTWLKEETEMGNVNLIDVARNFDPQGEYIKRFLPQLSNFPKECIHTPWRAPIELQKEFGCTIGESYPLPLYRDLETRFNLCKYRLAVFYSLIQTVCDMKSIASLGKRRMDCNE